MKENRVTVWLSNWWHEKRNLRFDLKEKDKEIVNLRRKVYELGEVIEKREDELNEYEKDIIIIADKITKERQEHADLLSVQSIKLALLETRVKKTEVSE